MCACVCRSLALYLSLYLTLSISLLFDLSRAYVAEPSRNIRGKRWGSEGGGREVEVERSQWAAACDAEGWKRCRALAVWAKWNQLCKHLAQIVIGAATNNQNKKEKRKEEEEGSWGAAN